MLLAEPGMKRFLVIYFLVGLAGGLLALAIYGPLSGLFVALDQFHGLSLIIDCIFLYFGGFLFLASYHLRNNRTSMIICFSLGIFAVCAGTVGVMTYTLSKAQRQQYSWVFWTLDGLEAIAFIGAGVTALTRSKTVRSQRDSTSR